jgi:hypothetical protein
MKYKFGDKLSKDRKLKVNSLILNLERLTVWFWQVYRKWVLSLTILLSHSLFILFCLFKTFVGSPILCYVYIYVVLYISSNSIFIWCILLEFEKRKKKERTLFGKTDGLILTSLPEMSIITYNFVESFIVYFVLFI